MNGRSFSSALLICSQSQSQGRKGERSLARLASEAQTNGFIMPKLSFQHFRFSVFTLAVAAVVVVVVGRIFQSGSGRGRG